MGFKYVQTIWDKIDVPEVSNTQHPVTLKMFYGHPLRSQF